MSLPASFNRVLALLKRLSPSWPSTDPDKSVGKELGSIAVALAMAADVVDLILDEVFPDTTTMLLDHWERITRNPVRIGDDLDVRRARILSVLRRVSGPRIDQLEKAIAPLLDLDVQDIVWVEGMRSSVQETLTEVVNVADDEPAPPQTFFMGNSWPGVVDDFGVWVHITQAGPSVTQVRVTHPDGTEWTSDEVTTEDYWFFTRDAFLGKPARGKWKVEWLDGSNLDQIELFVSNDVDSSRIYQFFALRDPDLPGTPDLAGAQRLLKRTALGNMRPRVVETFAFKTGDPHSLTGRDPLGA